MALQWGTLFKIVPENAVIADYIQRVTARPSFITVAEMDVEWAAEHERIAQENNA